MTFSEFQQSIQSNTRPGELSPALKALWEDAVGNWEGAHDIAQLADTTLGDRIHAYLHRKEGDLSNAGYWYSRSGETMPNATLEEEWKELVFRLL